MLTSNYTNIGKETEWYSRWPGRIFEDMTWAQLAGEKEPALGIVGGQHTRWATKAVSSGVRRRRIWYDLTRHVCFRSREEVGLDFSCNGKSLKAFKQGSYMIWLIFLRDFFGTWEDSEWWGSKKATTVIPMGDRYQWCGSGGWTESADPGYVPWRWNQWNLLMNWTWGVRKWT